MNKVNALLMAIGLVAAATYIYKVELSAVNPTGKEQPEQVFSGISPEAVQRITAVSPQHSFAVERRGYQAKKGESPTVLAPADAPWVLRRPEAALADQEEVKRLLEMAVRTQIAAAIVGEDQEADTSIYGLAPPEGVFTLEGGFGKRVLSFGKKIAISGRRYAQPEGDPRLYVIEDALASALLGEKSEIRQSQPFRFKTEEVEQVILQRSDADLLVLRREGEFNWRVEERDLSFNGDVEVISKALSRLSKAKVSNFVDEPDQSPAMYGLKNPRLIARVKLRSGSAKPLAVIQRESFRGNHQIAGEEATEFAVQVGEPVINRVSEVLGQAAAESANLKPRFYARISGVPTVYEFERPFFAELARGLEYFRPRAPFAGIPVGSLRKLTLKRAGKQLVLVRTAADSDGKWRTEGGDGPGGKAVVDEGLGVDQLSIDQSRVEQLVSRLRDLAVVDYLDISQAGGPETGLESPSLVVEMSVANGEQLTQRRISLGSKIGEATVKSNQETQSGRSEAPRWASVTMDDGVLLAAAVSHEVILPIDELAQALLP